MTTKVKQTLKAEFLSKDDILNADDLPMEEMIIPEWGDKKLYVATLNAKEMDEYTSSNVSIDEEGKTVQNMKNFRARLCVLCIRNVNRKQMFDISEAKKLGKKSSSVVNRIFNKAQEINGLGVVAVKKLEEN